MNNNIAKEFNLISLIKFSFPKLDGYLCQKNLLKSGSLTEFEDLFSDRLVKQS